MLSELLIREILRLADEAGHGATSSAIVQPLQKFGHAFFNGRQWEFHEETAIIGIYKARDKSVTVYGPGEWEAKSGGSVC